MSFTEKLKINILGENEKEFALVKVQRGSVSAVYKSVCGKFFLRIGEENKIKKDIYFQKEILEKGFQTSQILEEGFFENMYFYIENSLGEKRFCDLFEKDTKENGFISDENFDLFISVVEKFAETQLKNIYPENNFDEEKFKKAVHLDGVLVELPHLSEQILSRYQKAVENVNRFPKVLTHGDFNPFNIFPDGVIDFEDSFVGIFGYDVLTFYNNHTWFPEVGDFEFLSIYKNTEKQMQKFIDTLDEICSKHNLPNLSEYNEDFKFIKGLWNVYNMHKWPKIQNYRYKVFESLL